MSEDPGKAEMVTFGGRSYRKFIHHPEPVLDGTVRCFNCGQIDEPIAHDAAICATFTPVRAMNFDPSPWEPMTNPQDLKVLGKLGEECGELSAAVSRCIIQGIDEVEPVTRKPNREWLEDEIADVRANMRHVEDHFGLNSERMGARAIRKLQYVQRWLAGMTRPSGSPL